MVAAVPVEQVQGMGDGVSSFSIGGGTGKLGKSLSGKSWHSGLAIAL
jgi:hypothetical protein